MTPHPLYFALGSTLAERKSAYQSPFLSHLSDSTIQTIRGPKNMAWALDDDSFIEQVSDTLSRRAKPSPKGGDRRSKSFKTSKIKRILFFNEPCILNPCKT
jgi:putative transposase